MGIWGIREVDISLNSGFLAGRSPRTFSFVIVLFVFFATGPWISTYRYRSGLFRPHSLHGCGRRSIVHLFALFFTLGYAHIPPPMLSC